MTRLSEIWIEMLPDNSSKSRVCQLQTSLNLSRFSATRTRVKIKKTSTKSAKSQLDSRYPAKSMTTTSGKTQRLSVSKSKSISSKLISSPCKRSWIKSTLMKYTKKMIGSRWNYATWKSFLKRTTTWRLKFSRSKRWTMTRRQKLSQLRTKGLSEEMESSWSRWQTWRWKCETWKKRRL